MIILNFRVDTSKNKNIDLVKETCAIRSTQVTHETDHVSLLQDSTISSALIFVFYVFYCNLKRKRSNYNINSIKRTFLFRKSVFLLFWFVKLGSVGPCNKK